MPMISKLCRVVTYHGRLPQIKLHDPFDGLQRSCEKLIPLHLH